MTTLAEIRQQYPQYGDLDDAKLAEALHRKFYSDMPREEFDKRLGIMPKPEANPVADASEQLVRGVNRGLNALVALPGEIMGGAVDLIGGDGAKLRWNNPVSEFMSSPHAKPKTELGRYADAVGQSIGASAVPTAGLVAQAPRLAALTPTTAMRALGQNTGQAIQAAPGAAIAADAVAATGAGVGVQAAEEAGGGPVAKTVAGIAGGFAPLAVASVVSSAVKPIRRAIANQGEAGAYGSIVDNLGQGVDDLAGSIAQGTGSASAANSNRRALDILGEEMVAAGGDVRRAQQRAIARIAQEAGVTPQTAASHIRSLTAMYEDSPLLLAEAPAVTRGNEALRGDKGGLKKPENVDLDALNQIENSVPQATLDYLANNGNAQSAIRARNALAERQVGLADTMRGVADGIAPRSGGAPATIVDAQDMIERARVTGRAAYQQAYSAPINNQVAVSGLPRMLQFYDHAMRGRAGEAADAMRKALKEFYLDTPQGPIAMMSLQHLQDARGAVRGMITEAERQGRDHIVSVLQPFYRRVTRMMEAMSPEWARANRQWADMRFDRLGRELGDAFAAKAGARYRDQLDEFHGLHPQAQDIVRIHFLQQIRDKLDNLGDEHSIAKMFTNDHSRNAIRALFGDQAAVDFTRAVRDIAVTERSQAMTRNSATHRRGMAQKQMDADTGLVAAVNNASKEGVRNWLVEKATHILTERRNRPMADILSTPLSDTARIAMHLERMRGQRDRLAAINRRPLRPIPLGPAAAVPALAAEDR